MTIDDTRRVLTDYLDRHDENCLAVDAVFHDTASGRQTVGRDANPSDWHAEVRRDARTIRKQP